MPSMTVMMTVPVALPPAKVAVTLSVRVPALTPVTVRALLSVATVAMLLFVPLLMVRPVTTAEQPSCSVERTGWRTAVLKLPSVATLVRPEKVSVKVATFWVKTG